MQIETDLPTKSMMLKHVLASLTNFYNFPEYYQTVPLKLNTLNCF